MYRQLSESSEEELLAFAKSFSEAFPNPQRIGCPPIFELACMDARDGDPSIFLLFSLL